MGITDRPVAETRPSDGAYVWAALALLFVRLCIMPIGSSLWLDELGTSWITNGTLPQAVSRSLNWNPQSTVYMSISWMFQAVAGSSEMAMRIPSLIAYSFALIMVYKLGKRLIDADAALMALVPFIAVTSTFACDARPYAFALLVSLGAMWFLISWFDSGKLSSGILYTLLSAFTVYFHFLFAIMWGVHAVYAFARMRVSTPVSFGKFAAAAVATGVCVAPLLPQLFLAKAAPVGALRPRFLLLFQWFAPEFLPIAILAGSLLGALLFRDFAYRPITVRQADLWLMVCWATLAPLLLFAVSYVVSTKVFLPRYWSSAAAGLALLIAWAVRGFEPARARILIVLAIAGCTLLIDGGVRLRVRHNSENWRDAMAAERAYAAPDTPVLVRSGFVEAANPSFFRNPKNADINMAALIRYPAAGRVIPLAYFPDEPTLRELDKLVSEQLLQRDRFVLVSFADEGGFQSWLEGRLYTEAYHSRSLGDFGTVSVVAFERVSR